MGLYFSNSHLFHYKGYVLVYEANMYHLALYPNKKYFTTRDAFNEIDRLEEERIASENKTTNDSKGETTSTPYRKRER